MKFAFIVLHFKAVETTVKCIDSILELNNLNHNYNIVVVDNGSCDGTAEIIQEKYKNNIDLIKLDKGIGFSRANNKGYKYAVEKYNPDFIVMTNNDIIFKQREFIDKIVEINQQEKFDVLGPDILNPDGSHGNPYADRPRNIAEIKNYIKRAKIKKSLGVFYIIISDILKRPKNNIEKKCEPNEKKNVCLWGACLIFSKKFISANKKAFCPETMFYCEEDILCHRVIRDGGITLYSPEISVYHGHSESTRAAFKNKVARMKFCFKNDIESGKVYLAMLQKEQQ